MLSTHLGRRLLAASITLTAVVLVSRHLRTEQPAAIAPSAPWVASEEAATPPAVRLLEEHDELPNVGLLLAAEPCRRPSEIEKRELGRRVQRWISRGYPREHYELMTLAVGCVELAGIIVDVQADRWTVDGNRHDLGRWWTLRVRSDRILSLVETTGIAVNNWMEWAIESSRETVALADFDGDNEHDALSVRKVHEGAAVRSNFEISVIGSRRGVVQVATLRDVTLRTLAVEPTTILEIGHEDGRVTRRCIETSLRLKRC